MNSLEKLQLLEEYVKLRRKALKLDEGQTQSFIQGANQDPQVAQRAQQAGIGYEEQLAQETGGQVMPQQTPQQGVMNQQKVMGQNSNYSQPQTFQKQSPFSNKAGMKNLAGGLQEEAACSSEGAGSRTGMGEGVSSQRKEEKNDEWNICEGFNSYYKIAGIK